MTFLRNKIRKLYETRFFYKKKEFAFCDLCALLHQWNNFGFRKVTNEVGVEAATDILELLVWSFYIVSSKLSVAKIVLELLRITLLIIYKARVNSNSSHIYIYCSFKQWAYLEVDFCDIIKDGKVEIMVYTLISMWDW